MAENSPQKLLETENGREFLRDTSFTNMPETTGTLLLPIKAYEYLPQIRSNLWKAVMGGVGVFIVVFSVLTGSFFMAIAFAVFIWVYVKTHNDEDIAKLHNVALSTLGILIGNRFVAYSELQSYYFILEPDMTSLNFKYRKFGKSDEVIYLVNGEQIEDIQKTLKGKLIEEKGVEDTLMHRIIRSLKL